jgi:hypothetical protein
VFLAIKENSGLAYLCPTCEGSKTKVFALYRDFDSFKSELRKEFDDLKASLLSGQTAAPLANTAGAGAVQPNVDIQAEVKEALDKEKKRLNAVIVGLPENDLGKVRCSGDEKFVKDICGTLKIAQSDVLDVFRDGKIKESEGGRQFCRVIKVKFDSWASKLSFLKGFKRCVPSGVKAYVRHDLTFREREEERALKGRLAQYREQFKDAEIVINRGRIVYKGSKEVFSPSFHNLHLLAPGCLPPGGLGMAAAASQDR